PDAALSRSARRDIGLAAHRLSESHILGGWSCRPARSRPGATNRDGWQALEHEAAPHLCASPAREWDSPADGELLTAPRCCRYTPATQRRRPELHAPRKDGECRTAPPPRGHTAPG